MKTIKIAAGQGFWGDWLEAPIHQIKKGPIDYLVMDYLAEVTMSIMMRQKLKDPTQGYARDFVECIDRIMPDLVEKNIKVLANAGGVNPIACAKAVIAAAEKRGLGRRLKVAVVMGDDILPRLDELTAAGHDLRNMESKEPISIVRDRLISANVYFGAAPMVEALKSGAQIVITGRVTDTGLTLAPMIHEFGWAFDDWDRLSAGTVAGHINECGAQSSGGNCSLDWESIPDMANIGFPIIEARPDGSFDVTKHPGTGGRINAATVKEQLLYEMGDPKAYITPDCVADFSTIQLQEEGPDRVRVSGVRGLPATPSYKVSASFLDGHKAAGTLVYTWPDAVKKARAGIEILRKRLQNLGLNFDEFLGEVVGLSSCHGALTDSLEIDLPEATMRVAVRGKDRKAVERFTRELAPLILTGPPSVTGFAGGRPQVQEIVAYWPALIDKQVVRPVVEIVE